MKAKSVVFFNFLAVLSLFVSFILLYNRAYVNSDAAYYLGIARDISLGDVLYRDIHSIYTPVMMYMNAIVYYFFDSPPFILFIYFQSIITFGAGFLFYKIQRKLHHEKHTSALLSLLLVFTILIMDGKYIILEVYCVFFLLAAFLSYLYNRYLITGVLICLCILSKQYGIVNVLPFILLLFPYENFKKIKKYKGLFLFAAGGLLMTTLFFVYFNVINQVPIDALIHHLLGEGYGERHLSFSYPFFYFLYNERIALFLIMICFFFYRKKVINYISMVLMLGFVLNLMPTFIKQYPHYFILSVPYAFLFFSYNMKEIKSIVLLMLSLLVLYGNFMQYKQIFQKTKEHELQEIVAKEAEKRFPKGEEVFVDDNIRYLYILNDYRNPLRKDLGYRFEYDLDTINTQGINVLKPKDFKEITQ